MPHSRPEGATRQSQRQSLERLVRPKSVAVVGVSESSRMAVAIRRSLGSGAEFFFVHPKASEVFGHQTYPSLRDVQRPVDAVFSAVSAQRTPEVVKQAAELGAGGFVTIAGGFAEAGPEGAALQAAMTETARAANISLVGPNGIGLINVPGTLDLSMLAPFERRPGGLSMITASGAMIESVAAAARRVGGVGLNLLFSSGNEPVTDMADYLDFLAEDDATHVIALAIEKIRRPDAFFDAARRCLMTEKPIVAVKLGRSERSKRIAISHTATLVGDAWAYDVAFRQAGILMADDIDDLVDRVQFLEQLPRHKWTAVRGLAVLTATGGFAQLASDIADAENVNMPEAPRLEKFVAENIPGCTVTNPLDTTGFVMSEDGLWDRVLAEYAAADEFDAVLFASQHADWDTGVVHLADSFVNAMKDTDKAAVIAPLAGNAGDWLEKYRADEVAVGNGLRGCLRGFATMAAFKRLPPDTAVRPATLVPEIPRPAADPLRVSDGWMLPFGAAMGLLRASGVQVADYQILAEDDDAVLPAFGGPYVVKLADVAHRTEHGAVVTHVEPGNFRATVDKLRALARSHALSSKVVIQAQVSGFGEGFIGIDARSELGPLVAFGPGGTYIELMRRIAGRIAPMSRSDARQLLEELSDTAVFDGFRGARAWDREAIADTLTAVGQLAAGSRQWLSSMDINPLIITERGPVAVDALCLVRPESNVKRDEG